MKDAKRYTGGESPLSVKVIRTDFFLVASAMVGRRSLGSGKLKGSLGS